MNGKLWIALAALLALLTVAVPDIAVAQDDFSILDDLAMDDLVEVTPPPPAWQSIGGPIALGLFFFFLLWLGKFSVPFRVSKESLTLFYYPTGVKRGLALAITLYAIAFLFGALEIVYQLHLHGDAKTYFDNMSLGKLIAFTHAHLFGFTTSFLIIGIPFSMQFNHLWIYQWIFPVGLASALIDVISWWGIKYVSVNFEIISMICGILFSVTYLYMLVGLLRVLLFPHVIWATDKDKDVRRANQEAGKSESGY